MDQESTAIAASNATHGKPFNGIAYISDDGNQPDFGTREAMSKALQYCFPTARTWGPIVSPDTSVLPVDASANRNHLTRQVTDLLTHDWAVFLADERSVPLVIQSIPGLFMFRTRNGLSEIHRRQKNGVTEKVFPRV